MDAAGISGCQLANSALTGCILANYARPRQCAPLWRGLERL